MIGGRPGPARPRARRVLAAAAALLALPALAAAEEAAPAVKKKLAPPAVEKPGEAARPKGAGKRRKAPAKPPDFVNLPQAGEHEAEALLALAGTLTGRPVRIESDRVRRTKVRISEDLGGIEVTLAELTVLLAAHRLYLFPIVDPEEGKILVVSRNPTWSAQPEVFTRIIDVPAASFDVAARRIRKAVEEKNAGLPEALPPFVAVSSARVGKIFLRGPREADVEAIARLAEAGEESAAEREARRPRLYTYQGRYRKVEELEEDLVEELEEGERNLLRIVVGSRGNRLYYRCPPALGEKVQGLLEKLDRREKRRADPGKPQGPPVDPGAPSPKPGA